MAAIALSDLRQAHEFSRASETAEQGPVAGVGAGTVHNPLRAAPRPRFHVGSTSGAAGQQLYAAPCWSSLPHPESQGRPVRRPPGPDVGSFVSR